MMSNNLARLSSMQSQVGLIVLIGLTLSLAAVGGNALALAKAEIL